MSDTYTGKNIAIQLAQRAGQISLSSQEGGYKFVDDLTGQTLSSQPTSSIILANPQRPNDPKIKAQALSFVQGYYANSGAPPALIEAIASVAAYTSASRGIPVSSLFGQNGMSKEMLQAYNTFKPKGSQIGYTTSSGIPPWANNPTLRGSVAAAITSQP